MRVAVKIAGLAAAAALILWCATIAIHSFSPRAGAGLPRLAGGAGLGVLLGVAALIGAVLVAASAFALARRSCRREQPLGLIAALLAWAALTTAAASHAAGLFLAPVDYETGVGPDVPSEVATAWEAYFWTVAASCAVLAAALLVRRALASRAPSASAPTAAEHLPHHAQLLELEQLGEPQVDGAAGHHGGDHDHHQLHEAAGGEVLQRPPHPVGHRGERGGGRAARRPPPSPSAGRRSGRPRGAAGRTARRS